MSGPGARRPLAQLVGPQYESGLPYLHSRHLARVIGSCEHGHGIIGDFDGDDSIWVRDYRPIGTCDTCWREIAGWIQDDIMKLFECQDCGHSCRLEITAEWPTGNTTILRYTPRSQEREQ